MAISSKKWLADFLQLFYPHYCEGCGSDMLYAGQFLCSRCLISLPATGFFARADNPVEKIFYGRTDISAAGAAFFFTKQSLMQHLLIELKYRGNKEAGYFLGRMMAYALSASDRFHFVEAMVPLPLHPKKENSRGYNQAGLICKGIAEVWQKPVLEQAIIRREFTETQTHQNRIGRWENMLGVFEVTEPEQLENRHLLLVDDVITTGASLEACATAIRSAADCQISIATAAYTI
jgi:ComF family protein